MHKSMENVAKLNVSESCIAAKAGVALSPYANHGARRGLCALISNGELD